MPGYEYKLIAAPEKGEKARGARTAAERFALTLAALMNRLGADGWEYVRADTFHVEESRRFRGKQEASARLLVFRRELPERAGQPLPAAEAALPVRLVPELQRLVAERQAAPASDPERWPHGLHAPGHPSPQQGPGARDPREPPAGAGPRLGPARGDG